MTLACSFCGLSDREVKRLIAGPRVFICDACVGACNEISRANRRVATRRPRRPAPRAAAG